MVPVTMAKSGDNVVIRKITGSDKIRQHLAELGFVVDGRVTVVNEIAGNLILQVKDSRIALDKSMLSALMARHLLVKERYGKVYLTDAGYATAMRLERNIKKLEEKIPLMGISFTDDEIRKLARMIAVTLSEDDRDV